MSLEQHRAEAPAALGFAVVTVSDTRAESTDRGGDYLAAAIENAGHGVARRALVRDEAEAIRAEARAAAGDEAADLVLFTGGTGIAPRDVTPEAVEPLLDRVVPGFGELFRALSYEQIGSAALLSRALAGLASGRVVFVLPGSRGAIELAMEKLILPELGHLAAEAVKTR